MAETDIALMAHLMRRAGFGGTYQQVESQAAKGYEATVEELLVWGIRLRKPVWAFSASTVNGVINVITKDPADQLGLALGWILPAESRGRPEVRSHGVTCRP